MSGFAVPRGRGPAPLTARIAAALLWAGAALTLVWTAVSTACLAGFPGRLDAVAGEGSAVAWAALAALAVVGLVGAAAPALCALAMARGNAVGWYAALGVTVTLVVVAVLNRGMDDGGLPGLVLGLAADNAGYRDGAELALSSAPAWFGTYRFVQDCLTVLVLGVAGVLLLLPSTVDHFTRRPRVTGGYGVPWG